MNTLDANRDQSTIKKPVRFVHDLCSQLKAENPSMRRKDLVAAAVEQGVAYYTARTQVQVWLKAHPGGVAPAALVEPDACCPHCGGDLDDGALPGCADDNEHPLVFSGAALLSGGLIPRSEDHD